MLGGCWELLGDAVDVASVQDYLSGLDTYHLHSGLPTLRDLSQQAMLFTQGAPIALTVFFAVQRVHIASARPASRTRVA